MNDVVSVLVTDKYGSSGTCYWVSMVAPVIVTGNVFWRSGNEGKWASESKAGDQAKKSRKLALGGTPVVDAWRQAMRLESSDASSPFIRAHRLASLSHARRCAPD
ncbi:hypothetical protein E3N88_31055 [Mikania micrantha]|uniref:Uncharacterized protein n=1 Tax=Mikania micrantha TaxID=192012 RepID=A0A5N6MNB3_9ASTR|nr:hypothetical protein E3N88_31055 [Mikania micrantha]